MPKNIITILGVIIVLLTFITIPGSFKTPLYVIFGVAIAVIGYREKHPKRKGFLGAVVRRGRKIVGSVSSHTSHLSPSDTGIINQTETPKNTNEQMGTPTNQ